MPRHPFGFFRAASGGPDPVEYIQSLPGFTALYADMENHWNGGTGQLSAVNGAGLELTKASTFNNVAITEANRFTWKNGYLSGDGNTTLKNLIQNKDNLSVLTIARSVGGAQRSAYFQRSGGGTYLVSAYVSGGNLIERVQRNNGTSNNQTINLGAVSTNLIMQATRTGIATVPRAWYGDVAGDGAAVGGFNTGTLVYLRFPLSVSTEDFELGAAIILAGNGTDGLLSDEHVATLKTLMSNNRFFGSEGVTL